VRTAGVNALLSPEVLSLLVSLALPKSAEAANVPVGDWESVGSSLVANNSNRSRAERTGLCTPCEACDVRGERKDSGKWTGD
jgi:hypothetical protein